MDRRTASPPQGRANRSARSGSCGSPWRSTAAPPPACRRARARARTRRAPWRRPHRARRGSRSRVRLVSWVPHHCCVCASSWRTRTSAARRATEPPPALLSTAACRVFCEATWLTNIRTVRGHTRANASQREGEREQRAWGITVHPNVQPATAPISKQ
eukprot:1988107-Prymnesium_polylepis.1